MIIYADFQELLCDLEIEREIQQVLLEAAKTLRNSQQKASLALQQEGLSEMEQQHEREVEIALEQSERQLLGEAFQKASPRMRIRVRLERSTLRAGSEPLPVVRARASLRVAS